MLAPRSLAALAPFFFLPPSRLLPTHLPPLLLFTSRSDHIFSTCPSSDAVMGVSTFGNLAPDAFGAFDRAFVTMFRILAGDTWVRASTDCARRACARPYKITVCDFSLMILDLDFI
jgi:hypothetical protein